MPASHKHGRSELEGVSRSTGVLELQKWQEKVQQRFTIMCTLLQVGCCQQSSATLLMRLYRLLLKCDYEYSFQQNDQGGQAKVGSPASSTEGPPASQLQSASKLFQTVSYLSMSANKGAADIPAQVLTTLIANGEGVPSVAHTFFRTIDVWLPIISPTECMRRLETIGTDRNNELSCLLLCMYLATQPPGSGDAITEMQTATYFQAKALHSAFVSAGNCALDIIQAGVLVCLYEQGHGMIDAAQLTMAACIRMATKVKIALGSSTQVQNTEFGRLWWGILMLDR